MELFKKKSLWKSLTVHFKYKAIPDISGNTHNLRSFNIFFLQGVHLDEPTSPATDKWSGHVTSPVRSQWTEEELDAFVRQLSNPQHHVTKRTTRDHASSPTGRKCSLDLNHGVRGRVRAPLARSETDSSVSFGELESPTLEEGEGAAVGGEVRGASLVSGMSGLRLIKNKKMARTSHSNIRRYAKQKPRDEHQATSVSSLLNVEEEGLAEAAAAAAVIRDPTGNSVTFSCSSSPDGSDGEVGGDRGLSGHVANGTGKDMGKKRRFRKILTRPLNRSQSAGCAKDVPAHALFLEQQRKKSKEAEVVCICLFI